MSSLSWQRSSLPPALGWVEGLKVEGQGALKKVTESVGQPEPSPLLPRRPPNSALPPFTVTMEMDIFAGIDYSLMEAPQATAEILDVMFKVKESGAGLGRVQARCGVASGSTLPGASCSPGFRSVLISPWFPLSQGQGDMDCCGVLPEPGSSHGVFFCCCCAVSSLRCAGFSLRWLLLLRSTGSRAQAQ